MSITVEQFVSRLTECGLLSAAEVSTYRDSVPPEQLPRDAQTLASGLVKAGKLTKYQAQAVYQGKTKGLVFGEYVVLDKIGQGGMGVVLKARHRRMDRVVAVKVLPDAAMKQPGAVERFYREVKAAAKLSHPNIVTAHDAGEHQGMHYLVMEYVEGRDLAGVVKERGCMGVQEALECTLQAARGLQYAHEQGIVHRDIKPGNLLLDKKGKVKILDMGLARIAGPDAGLGGEERLTGSGQVMGTCDYMAPEQALDTHTADQRADIYSLGCTLYRLLTGSPPYRAESFAKLFLMHMEAPIPSLCKARPEVPEALDTICERMLAKKPEDRYQSVAEVVVDLEATSAALTGRSVVAAASADPSNAAMAQSLAFLQEDQRQAVLTQPRRSTAEQHTHPNIAAEHDTATNLVMKARRAIAKVQRKQLLAIGLIGGLSLLLGIVLAITSRHGTLVIEIDEELGKDIQVAVSQGGEKVQLVDAKSGWTLRLGTGKYDLSVQGGDDQFQLDSQSIVVTRGGQAKVRVTLKSNTAPTPTKGPAPPSAIAPFDEKKAKEHQAAWAKHLGVPIEITNSIGMKLALIPPGEFMIGSPKELIEEELKRPDNESWYTDRLPSEGPQHRVRITKAFYLGVTEVTQEEYQRVIGNNPSGFSATGKGKDNVVGQDTKRFPVEMVSWHEAVDFCRKLSDLPEEQGAGRMYVLPSEAQWEYACRAGSTGRYSFSSGRGGIAKENEERELPDYGWFGVNAEGRTHAVGGKRAGVWGLHDMHGNVWEWCQDWYDKDYYAKSVIDDPTGALGGDSRVHRGGSWFNPAKDYRSARRNSSEPRRRADDIGLRVSLVLADKPGERNSPPSTTAAPSELSTSPTVAPAKPDGQESSVTQPSPVIGPDGKWNLPPGAPSPAIAPFDAQKAKEHQEAWAKYLGVQAEMSNSLGMKFMLIPPGEFSMGSTEADVDRLLAEAKANTLPDAYIRLLPSESPKHRVRITKPFYFGMCEVTQAEYQRLIGSNPSGFKGNATCPVEMVSWEDAFAFCRKLSELSQEKAAGAVYRLPTEAEWEYACRVGTVTTWSGTDDEVALKEQAWFALNSDAKTQPVSQKKPNAWGLYDIHGNVWEWCADWHGDYGASPLDNPNGPTTGSRRMLRGGGCGHVAMICRSAHRGDTEPGARANDLGFRVVRVAAG